MSVDGRGAPLRRAVGDVAPLLAFAHAHPVPGPDALLRERLLTRLVRGPDAILDLWEGGERQAVAVVMDTCANVDHSASVEVLGLRSLSDAGVQALLAAAEEIAWAGPLRALDVALPPALDRWRPWVEARGYAPAYAMFLLARPAALPLVAPRSPLPVGARWVSVTEDRYAGYHRVVSRAFADLPGAQIPVLEEMAAGLRRAPLVPEQLVLGERVLAFAAVGLDRETGAGEVRSVGRDPDARGLGLGDHILDRALRRLLDLGATRITLEVAARNAEALALYQRHGFERNEVVEVWRKSLNA